MKKSIEQAVIPLTELFSQHIKLLLSVPGIKDTLTAIAIIGEIGVDMSVFLSDKHLCSWAGMTPQNNESAGKKKSVRVSRAGAYIKPLLIQCANAAIKSKQCLYFGIRFDQIKRRRGHKRAILAIARMLLTCIYHMLKNGEFFNHELYQVNQSVPHRVLPVIDTAQAVAFLESIGATVILPTSH